MLRDALTVAAGAALGALARFAVEHVLGAGMWPLLAVNVLGSLLMGALRPGLFWGTGVLGGFTSFSTFAVLTADSSAAGAAGYVAATVIGCVGAWLLGDRWARSARSARRRKAGGR
ncbi:fluoride efflux transporter family protein [Corynebacterium halotolerans]|uniref:Fluoride-specific ion channel FluC n=1 Tax=Corynebacterium halotolerans YIM 70093 = DSM 44683 TaxID=1121362 RepID=M1P9J1_9CORY|nr:fluoride efflux transporter family protein [Corynebacterium halotolerans]AGF73341.1 camphor resistance protein CrcB [Corynebacterium halotolerans YIM 70093 = DSM 44683]